MRGIVSSIATVLLVSLVSSGLNKPAMANGPYWDIEQNGSPIQNLNVPVSSTFTVEIWIRNIPNGDYLHYILFLVYWDPEMIELVDRQKGYVQGWDGESMAYPVEPEDLPGFVGLEYYALGIGYGLTEDTRILILTFHCLRAGISPITLGTEDSLLSFNQLGDVEPPPFVLTSNQVYTPVGGITTPINKLEIVAPFAALAGLIVAVSAVVAVKKRRA
jgi:hypothetical protein